jgi:Holliday junction resolvasome RuvABC endonuclease subunit
VCRAPAGRKDLIQVHTRKLADTTDLGAYLRSADQHIRDEFEGASAIAVEQPNTAGQHYSGIRKNIALIGHIHYWASIYGLQVTEINVSAVKIAMTGHGHAKKEQVILGAYKFLGTDPTTHPLDEHMADAIGVWHVFSYGVQESTRQREDRERKERTAAKRAAKAAGPLL